MSKCYQFKENGVIMSAEQTVEKIQSTLIGNPELLQGLQLALFSKPLTNQSEIADTIEKLKSTYNNSDTEYMGVSSFLESKHTLSGDTIPHYLFPAYNQENRIENYIKQNTEEGEDPSLSRQEIEAQIQDEQLEKEMGTLQHALIQAMFDSEGEQSSAQIKDAIAKVKSGLNKYIDINGVRRSLRDIVTKENPTLKDDVIVSKMLQNAKTIYDNFTHDPKYQGAKFYAEAGIITKDATLPDVKYKGVRGIADLIIVKKDGTVDIIDFKVAHTPFNQWCATKLYKTEYQLGAYRQILAANGIDINKVGLYTQPIFLNRHNAEDTHIEPVKDLLLAKASRTQPYAHLHPNFGLFTKNLHELIGTKLTMTVPESVKIDSEAINLFNKMIDYNPVEKNYSKDELSERVYDEKRGDKIVYRFYDVSERKPVENADKEFFTRDGGYLDQYIAKMKNIRNEWVKTLQKEIQQYKEDGKRSGFDFLHSKNQGGKLNQILANIFGQFCKPEYNILDIPVMTENGILVFENINSHTLHFINITDQNLTAPIGDGQYTNILGNFYNNSDAVRRFNHLTVLPATVQNAELLKVVHLINSIADANENFFQDHAIGSIRVLNPQYGTNSSGTTVKDLLSNYNILCHETQTTNHFNKDIQLVDEWKEFMFELESIMAEYEEDEELKMLVRSFKKGADDKINRIGKLLRLRKKLEILKPQYRQKNFLAEQSYQTNDPLNDFYIDLCGLIAYYQKIPIDPSGNFDQYGFRFSSVLDLLGIPFISNQQMVDKDGTPIRGIASGTDVTSAENSPSPTLRALAEYYQVAYGHVREEFQAARSNIIKYTMPYINAHVSSANKLLFGVNTEMWEDLLVKDKNGEVSKSLMLRNPYTDKTLTDQQAKFLKAILWEINKYRYHKYLYEYTNLTYETNQAQIEDILFDPDSEANKLISNQRYFELPLKRARYFERWKKVSRMGVGTVVSKELKNLKDDWDPTQMHGTQRSMIATELRKNATTMYNQYDISASDRMQLIEKEDFEDFEVDLDLLAMDCAFQAIRKQYYEDVLQTTAAIATLLHVNQAMTGINRHAEIEALENRSKTAIKGESVIKEEAENISSVVSAARRLNSFLVLAFRPLQFVKEISFGTFTNLSRVFASKGSSDVLSLKSVYGAYKTIWGQSIEKWAHVFGGDQDMASFTLCEAINKIYGIANEDINRTVEASATSRIGLLANKSKLMYWANQVPDYFNRLTLFIAKMMEDGCWEAHTLTKEGILKYDFKKDKRFSELVKHGLNSNYQGEEYKKQKALYIAMAEQFELEGRHFITYKADGTIEYKEFDRAYTTKQRNSIKEVADLAYGYYDHETKSLIDLGFFGLIYKQFQTFLTAKTNLWFRGRPTTKGDNTAQGAFVPVVINGEQYYRRILPNGDVQEVPESELTAEEKGNLDYAYRWQGAYVEGLCYSILGTLKDFFRLNWSEIRNNKYRLGNLKLAMHDILIGMLLYSIFKWLFSKGTNKMSDIKPLQRVFVRSLQDVSPTAITSMNWEPGFYSTLTNLRDGAIQVFTADDPDLLNMIKRQVGAVRDWTYNNPAE